MPEVGDSQVDRIRAVVADVAARARAAGRSPDEITIVAVTKTLPPAAAEAALAAGLRDMGESYVQEARDKRSVVSGAATWHLIGPLQRNKVNAAVRVFDRVHSIADVGVARALDAAVARRGPRLPVLLQVDVAGHPAGHGVRPDDAPAMARTVGALSHLALDGLMCLGLPDASSEEIRRAFRALRGLRDDLGAATGLELPHLSMGMSDDYTIAIEEGATMLRLGRVLFGARGPAPWREGT
jgi:pyridoxal phosphate enzyme (YggS family)